MDARAIATMQHSFIRIFPAKAEIADLFYTRLFDARPEYKDLFSQDMHTQREMFAGVITQAVRNLNDYPNRSGVVERIGAAHRGMGLTPADFHIAEDALIQALKDAPSVQLNNEELHAWSAAIRWLVNGVIKECCRAA